MIDEDKLRKDIFVMREALFSWMEYCEFLLEGEDENVLDKLLEKAVLETKKGISSRHIAEFLGAGRDGDDDGVA